MRVFWGWLNFKSVQRNIQFFKKQFSLFLGPPPLVHRTKAFLKSSVLQLFNKFSAFYRNRRFITAFTTAHTVSLFWAIPIQPTTLKPISLKSVLILSSQVSLGLPDGRFTSEFPAKALLVHATSSAHLFRLDFITLIILMKSTINKAHLCAVTPVLSYLGPLRPKYFPQRPIPKHNQSMFFPQFELPSSHNRQNYNYIFFILYVFKHQTGRHRFRTES